MWRLNVQETQVEECIRTSLFAIDVLPRNPPLKAGDLLLLQLVKDDAERLGKLKRRIEFALVFERAIPDPTGELSRLHWPLAGKTWSYILECSETVATLPFSLEDLRLSRRYSGQANPMHIREHDAATIHPFVKAAAELPAVLELTSVHALLIAIRNYDTVVRLAPVRTTRVKEHERRLQDPWLPNALKVLYEHKCQVCTHDFTARYDTPYADTRFIQAIEDGGEPVSKNVVVLCPNHDKIIQVTRATFDRNALAFTFPNGLRERLLLREHLVV